MTQHHTPATGAPQPTPLDDATLESVGRTASELLRALNTAVIGQERVTLAVATGVLARGHVLLEGMPGLGKTALIRTLGEALKLDFGRVQFTPDLMPGDIVGSPILEERAGGGRDMVFREGPVFTNILLADEINRASPKTQSALLEAMQERRVTVMGETRELPDPFFVLASQNPIELEGTYPLPEAQLDRFMLKVQIDMPGTDALERIVATRRHGEAPATSVSIDRYRLDAVYEALDRVILPAAVGRYIARLVGATHPGSDEAPEAVRRFVRHGASPRAAIAIAEAARVVALLDRRPTVGFEDVRTIAPDALRHRLVMSYDAALERTDATQVITALLAALDEVGGALPKGVRVDAP